MQRGSPTDSELLTGSMVRWNANPSYLCLHHNKMQANWHQYIECMSMRVGVLTNIGLKGNLKETLTLATT
uniref:Late blight resistance protein n=1 Tax=Solanum tuberosum TaxID=4113 RepID=M1BXQ8_SOLTU